MTTLKGIFPDSKSIKGKNFIYENVKNLRQLHANKGTEETQKSQVSSQRKTTNNVNCSNNYNNVLPKVNTNLRMRKHDTNVNINVNVNTKLDQQELCKKTSASTLNKNNVPMKKTIHSTSNNLVVKERKKGYKELHKCRQKLHENVSLNPDISYKSVGDNDNDIKVKVKNQGIQTLDTNEIENIYSEGIVKYPSKKYLNCNETTKNDTNEEINPSSRSINSPLDQGDIFEKNIQNKKNKSDTKNSKSLSSKEEVNFIKLNKEHSFATNKTTTQVNNNTSNNTNNNNNNNNNNNLPTNYRMGVVPKYVTYIKNRKEIQEKIEKAKQEELDPNCPNGHVPLPDNERKETLQMLKKNYQDYVNELNMMPIKVDTLRVQRRKIEIEKQLNKLEEGIKVFSRPKVYVKMNA